MKKSVTLVALFAVASSTMAWDGFGHKVVARIAYDHLTPAAKAKIDRILQSHPGTVKDGNRDVDFKNFVNAATWPDEIRRSKLDHPTWHYVDFPFNVGTYKGPEPATTNLLSQLAASIADAGARKPDADLAQHISWIEHLVGDMHQPLHCTSLFDAAHLPPDGDRGGNGYVLAGSRGGAIKLHSYWDHALELNDGTIDSVTAEAEKVKIPAVKLPKDPAKLQATLAKWAKDSYNLASTVVYRQTPGATGPLLEEHKPFPDGYAERTYKVAVKQVALAGARLAAILNSVYG